MQPLTHPSYLKIVRQDGSESPFCPSHEDFLRDDWEEYTPCFLWGTAIERLIAGKRVAHMDWLPNYYLILIDGRIVLDWSDPVKKGKRPEALDHVFLGCTPEDFTKPVWMEWTPLEEVEIES